ncbi:MAG TPA: hypothetical protein VGH28_26435 [Polyangiaceae bacterium]|jgi:hypothetical protein
MRARFESICFAGVLALAACGGPAAKNAGPTSSRISRSDTRKSVSVTVYNDGFGLVREVRDVDLGTGRVSLEFRDVSSQIEADTVHVKSLAKGNPISILEQNYRYDLLSPQSLLKKYEGKKIRLYRWNKTTGKDEAVDAEVLSVNDNQPVLRVGNEVTYGFPARFSFPEVPDNLIAQPTLVWLLDSDAPKQPLEVTYLSQGFGWAADYVLTIGEEAAGGMSSADLHGWVTLKNETSTSYENARLKLVAGNVQRVRERLEKDESEDDRDGVAEERQQFKEESFFEYHLYTLDRPTTLLSNEQKQVTLLEGHGVQVHRQLIFYGASYYYRGSYGQVVSNQKVGVYLEIQNEEKNHLGIPLPKGTIRVYKADKSGAAQFIGEDAIDHTPRDEQLRVKMGDSFDVVGDRTQTDFKQISSCVDETTWEIALRNHKDTADEVLVYEPIEGDWEILGSSIPYQKKDAHTFTFRANVGARGETKITYRVRVRWC